MIWLTVFRENLSNIILYNVVMNESVIATDRKFECFFSHINIQRWWKTWCGPSLLMDLLQNLIGWVAFVPIYLWILKNSDSVQCCRHRDELTNWATFGRVAIKNWDAAILCLNHYQCNFNGQFGDWATFRACACATIWQNCWPNLVVVE